MAEIVNLRRERKRLAREMDARKAEENRNLHGMTRSQRQKAGLEKLQFNRLLDQARLGGTPDPADRAQTAPVGEEERGQRDTRPDDSES